MQAHKTHLSFLRLVHALTMCVGPMSRKIIVYRSYTFQRGNSLNLSEIKIYQTHRMESKNILTEVYNAYDLFYSLLQSKTIKIKILI